LVSGLPHATRRAIHTRFRSASVAERLRLAAYGNSLGHYAKGTPQHLIYMVPRPLVSRWFQELFHSPPGVLFSFRSPYSSLSVYQEYLALEGGPPRFTPGFTRLALLGCRISLNQLRIQAYHLVSGGFPATSARFMSTMTSVPQPR
jgi:hypothetical protein